MRFLYKFSDYKNEINPKGIWMANQLNRNKKHSPCVTNLVHGKKNAPRYILKLTQGIQSHKRVQQQEQEEEWCRNTMYSSRHKWRNRYSPAGNANREKLASKCQKTRFEILLRWLPALLATQHQSKWKWIWTMPIYFLQH